VDVRGEKYFGWDGEYSGGTSSNLMAVCGVNFGSEYVIYVAVRCL
jgi:hypothetical protein